MNEEDKKLIAQFRKENPEANEISDDVILDYIKEQNAPKEQVKTQPTFQEPTAQTEPKQQISGIEAFARGVPKGATYNWLDELGLGNKERQKMAEEQQFFPELAGEIAGGAGTSLAMAALVEALARGRFKGKLVSPALANFITNYPRLAPALGGMTEAFVAGAGEAEPGARLLEGGESAIASGLTSQLLKGVGVAGKKILNPRTWQDWSDYLRYKSLGGPAGTPTRTALEKAIGSGETPEQFVGRVAQLTREYPELMPEKSRYEAVQSVLDRFNTAKKQMFELAKEKGINVPKKELTKLPRDAMSELGYLSASGEPLPSFKTQFKELKTMKGDIAQYKPTQTYTDKQGKVMPALPIEDVDKLRSQFGKKTFDYASGTSDPYSFMYGKTRKLVQEGLESTQPGLGKNYDEIMRNINTASAIKNISDEAQSRSISNNIIGLGTSSLAGLFPEQGGLGKLQAVTGVLGLKRYGAELGYPITEAIGSGLEFVGKPLGAITRPITSGVQSQLGQDIMGSLRKSASRTIGAKSTTTKRSEGQELGL